MGLFNFMQQRCANRHGPASSWIVRRVSRKLQLDEQQQTRLLSLHTAILASQAHLTEIHRDRGTLLDDIFTDHGFDRESALHYLNVPRLAFEEQVPAIIDSLDEFYQCLSPEQRAQLRSVLRKRHEQRSRCWH
jgi:Spy/CpxP family protein refolding chaperone